MATITINDLPASKTLDRKAMSTIRGAGGAPWVFGWIRPFVEGSSGQVPVINFYQINNYADQMINQYQMVNVNNSGNNANLTVGVDERSVNNGKV
ncbi:MAG TPA: hypothetical protein VGF27_00050 [Pseudoduganella sp.]|jgi:hypothetical protein